MFNFNGLIMYLPLASHTKTANISTPSRKKFKRLLIAFFLTGITLLGFILIIVGLGAFEEGTLMYTFFVHGGTALVPLGFVSIIYEVVMREHQMNEIKEGVQAGIDNLNIPQKVDQLMPSRYTNIRNSGITDVYPTGNTHGFEAELAMLRNQEVRILGIYLENAPKICNALKDAVVNRGCAVKIILWDPRELDALKKRAESLGLASNEQMVNQIKMSLQTIVNTWAKMTPEHAKKIEVKLYKSFIGVALMGFEGCYLVGFYLRERYVSFGTHIKVIDASRHFYVELDTHFKSQWSDETNTLFEADTLGKL